MLKLTLLFFLGSLLLILQSTCISARYLSCPPGWVTYKESSYCYRVGTKPTTKWNEARKACLSMGGDLVKIRSARENRYVALLARTYSSRSSSMWMGLVGESNNVFTWVDGSALSGQYTNWRTGEPNNYKGKAEDCGVMNLARLNWNDEICVNNSALMYLCEKEKQY